MVKRCSKDNLTIVAENDSIAVWFVRAPADHTKEDCLHPQYFAYHMEGNTQKGIRVGDKLEIRPNDMSWHLEAVVRNCDLTLGECDLAETNYVEFKASHELPQGWEARYESDDVRWCIYNGMKRIEGGLPTREAAIKRGRYLAKESGVSMPEDKKPAAKRKPAAKKEEVEA